jgi:hypothetical protein
MITKTTIVTAPNILGSEISDIDTVIFDAAIATTGPQIRCLT